MRRAAGATPDANGHPDGFDHSARRKRTRRVCFDVRNASRAGDALIKHS
jgi:hypothetical protein